MSKYTTMLRWPIEQRLDGLGYNHKESNWKYCYSMLGLDDYPIFDDTYRETLNNKIIRAYYFREIGFETLGLFSWQMRRTMHEIMPYYNQLYKSELLVTDPLLSRNMDYTEKWTRDEKTERDITTDTVTSDTSHGTGSEHDTGSTTDRNVLQDTPMNGLDTGAIEAMDYATNVTFDNATSQSDTSTTSDRSSNGTSNVKQGNDYTGDFDGTKEHNEKGYDGSQSELLLTYRKTFLNIDLEIVDSLNVLFMGLW